METARGSRVEHWLKCPHKTCCSYYLVYVTGDDVARIARTLAVPPWSFTVALPCEATDVGAFALDKSPARHRLALSRTRIAEGQQPFCTFLVRAVDGAARCGLGPGRPAPCRSFPVQLVDGALASEMSGCTCDWSQVALDDPADVEALRAEERARNAYGAIIAAWNDYVATVSETVHLTHQDFCRYLLDAYSPTASAS
jgi:hypothetical protein